MNTATKIFAAAALSALAVVGAQAETYEGVHALTSGATRGAVQTQGVQAARSGNPFSDSYGEGVATNAGTASRTSVRQDAVAAAHAPNPYAEGAGEGVATVNSTVDRASVRAAARATARGDQLPL
jgi:hypothetical protein